MISNSFADTTSYSQTWPLWWRLCMLGSLSWFVMMGQVMTASVPPMLGPLIQQFHISPTEASHLASWAVLALGFGVSLSPSSSILAGFVPCDHSFR